MFFCYNYIGDYMKTILVTGASGFIGCYLCKRLIKDNVSIIGLDNMNDYYDIKLKEYRIKDLINNKNFTFIKGDLSDKDLLDKIFKEYKPEIVVNLGAQAGVRYSIDNPDSYIISNIIGFYNILEVCRCYPVKHLIYASSSSIYGDNNKLPFNLEDKTDNPISLYAATKKSNELFAYSYSRQFNIPCTGLRLFTVYGPAGRPDMGYFKFVKMILNKEKIELYNNGDIKRDFTYIDDVIESIYRVINNKPKNTYNIYNIGNEKPILIKDIINILCDNMRKIGLIDNNYRVEDYFEYHEEIPSGDVYETYSDTSKFYEDYNYKPNTSIETGLNNFINWYKDYYK